MPASCGLQQFQQGSLVGVGDLAAAVANDVHAKQSLLESEPRQDDAGGRARTDQPGAAPEHLVDQVVGDRILGRRLAAERTRLRALKVLARVGDVQEPVQPGGDRAGAEQRLIDIHHLGRPHAAHAVLGETRRQLARASRVDCEDSGMHLYSRGDAEHRNSVADRLQHIDRGAISAGEQEQVDPALRHCRRRRARVLGGGHPAGRSKHRGRQLCAAGFVLTHRACIRQDLDVAAERGKAPERLGRTSRGDRGLTALARRRDQSDVIASLERQPPAHAGDRINDEAESHVCQYASSITRPIARSGP